MKILLESLPCGERNGGCGGEESDSSKTYSDHRHSLYQSL
jgi:hypothetical protein